MGPEVSEHFAFAVGASAQILMGVAPNALIGGQAWFRARWERGSIWSPELGVSFAHQRLDGFSRAEGEVDFALNSASLDVCPLRVGTAAVQLQPCAVGSLGRLQAQGHETYFPGGDTRPWATLGGNAQLVARFDIVELRGSFGVARPLVRDGFRFGPSCSDASCEADIFHRVDAAAMVGDFLQRSVLEPTAGASYGPFPLSMAGDFPDRGGAAEYTHGGCRVHRCWPWNVVRAAARTRPRRVSKGCSSSSIPSSGGRFGVWGWPQRWPRR
jgi:hypothetical protein